uniref:Putative secreted protein n=1 Tax=Ixodes ricinus TaxID=34613 RepID=A0A6B0UMR9_IXORI
MSCVPLRRQRPSLGLSLIGVSLCDSSTYLASPQPVSGLHIFPSPISPSAKCARGARSPLAPTVPCSGTQDRHDALKASTSCSKVSVEMPLYPLASTLIRSASNIRVFSGDNGFPTPAE